MKVKPMVADLIHQVEQIASEAFEISITEGNLTLRQYAVLRAIQAAEGPPSQTHIVKATGIDRSTIADVVARLETRKLVSRKRTRADARAYALQLTKEGAAALKSAEAASLASEAAILNCLSPDERRVFIKMLERIVEQPPV
jgi:DNA-binding MarR family transcriptional regulator